MIALRETLRSGQKSKDDIVLQRRHFERAFSVVRPSVGERERAKYEAMGKKYGVTVEESAADTQTMVEEVTLKNDPMETEAASANIENECYEKLGDVTEDVTEDVVMTVDKQEMLSHQEEDLIRINDVTSVACREPHGVTPPRPALRFLEDMEVRISDKCENAEAAGQIGAVIETSENGNDVLVDLLYVNGQVHVSADNVEPSLPEEGDRVKILVWDAGEESGLVLTIDEDDNAKVEVGGAESEAVTNVYSLEKLCKIYVGPSGAGL